MFNTKIPLYGILIIISFICGLIVIYKNIKILKYKQEEIMGLLIYLVLGGIFGAKYFTFIINFTKYKDSFDFFKIGLSSYGAVMGILFMLFLFAKQFKKSFKQLLYVSLPALPLMYGIGKIGCFLAGCCYGIEYNGPFKVMYKYAFNTPQDIYLFPVQLLETIIYLIIFVYINYLVHKEKNINQVISLSFILCGTFKFLLDFLRMSHVGKILSINQIISIAFIVIGVIIIIKGNKDGKKTRNISYNK